MGMYFDLEYSRRKTDPTTGGTLRFIGSIKGDIIDIYYALEDPEQDARNIALYDSRYQHVKRYYPEKIHSPLLDYSPWNRRQLLMQIFGKPEIL